MSRAQRISEAEWEVAKVVWDDSPVTANDVVERVSEKRDWNHRTVRTLLNRLVKKKVLSFKKDGNRYLYYPEVERSELAGREAESFLERVFDGALTPMLLHFVDNADLSQKDVEALKKILDSKEKG